MQFLEVGTYSSVQPNVCIMVNRSKDAWRSSVFFGSRPQQRFSRWFCCFWKMLKCWKRSLWLLPIPWRKVVLEIDAGYYLVEGFFSKGSRKLQATVYGSNKRLAEQWAELAQSAERTTLNRVVEGSIPSFGVFCWIPPFSFSFCYRGGCDQKHHSITQLQHALTWRLCVGQKDTGQSWTLISS